MFDFRKLEAFCRVYEQRSFSKAGDVLFLSQPTVSAHVQSLERDAGAKLLDRMGRTVLPTPAGTVLYRHAIKAFAELELARNEINHLMGDIAGDVLLGASTIPATFLLPSIVAKFANKFPQVNLKLTVGASSAISKAVLDGDIMFGVVGALEKNIDLEFLPVVDDELVVVAAPALKIKQGKEPFDMAEACKWPWVMREEGSGTRRNFEKGLLNAGYRPRSLNIVLSVDSTQAVVQYALAGLGVTVTSRMAVATELARGELIELQIAGVKLYRKFYIVHSLRRDFFPAAASFVSSIQEATALMRE
ncbi:LysR family transcriptional regulator [Desulfovibrio sp. OttesenSCG-928-F07]|nr:LysR family transcriptional regulator [Desulfovibrio sp. OttesenSCG-928-F07]